MTVALDADDPQRQDVADVHCFARVGDAPLYQLRYVDQALNRAFDAGEGAKRDELGDNAGDDVVHLVLVDYAVPLGRLGPPYAEGDLLRLSVDLHYEDVDFVTDLEELFRG